MRQIREPPKEGIPRKKPREPLDEGIVVPTDSGGRRMWRKLTDEQLVAHAKQYTQENKITSRGEFQRLNSSLYNALAKRGVLDDALASKLKNWSAMSDQELIEHAKEFVKEHKIEFRTQIGRINNGLSNALRQRKLMDKVMGLKRRKWSSKEEILAYAREFLEEKNISSRKELELADVGLYNGLNSRNLLDELLELKYRDWKSMSQEELASHASASIKEKGIKSRKELGQIDSGLHQVLIARGLLDEVLPSKLRDWASFTDEELVEKAKSFVAENKIRSRSAFQHSDSGFYVALSSRGLVDSVIPPKLRNWKSLGDSELLAHAKAFISQNNILSRRELKQADHGLFSVLQKRRLMKKVFAELESNQQKAAVQEVLDELEEFGVRE